MKPVKIDWTKKSTKDLPAEILKNCIARDVEGKLFKFDTASHCHLVAAAIETRYDNYEAFDTAFMAEANKDEYFQAQIAKYGPTKLRFKLKSWTDKSLLIWAAWWASAEDRLSSSDTNPVNVSKSKGGKKSLGARNYSLTEPPAGSALETPQAIACLAMIIAVAGEAKSCTEESLKAHVIAHAAELKTRQDPWRIFQYYRPTLIKLGYLKHD